MKAAAAMSFAEIAFQSRLKSNCKYAIIIAETEDFMFAGFSREALDFLNGIRFNNNKSWFEAHKKTYLDKVYHPMKELGADLYKPFEKNSAMMCKVGRIYRDEFFPPYLHYRDTMWIYVRYQAMYWSKTPTLYFELSPEGAEFGFRIAKPEAAVMELFRSRLTEDSAEFLKMTRNLEKKHGIIFAGEEYKRKKPCTVPEAEQFFLKKGLSAFVRVPEGEELFSEALLPHINKTFKALIPLNDYFHDIVTQAELAKLMKNPIAEEASPVAVKAPEHEFMW